MALLQAWLWVFRGAWLDRVRNTPDAPAPWHDGRGLQLGIMWAIWHLPFQRGWPGVAISGGLPLVPFLAATFLLMLIGELVAYRILMVWVYQWTESLPVAILMHASLSACRLSSDRRDRRVDSVGL